MSWKEKNWDKLIVCLKRELQVLIKWSDIIVSWLMPTILIPGEIFHYEKDVCMEIESEQSARFVNTEVNLQVAYDT